MNTINPVDKFRNDFFEKLIKEEKEKEKAVIAAQKRCNHTFDILARPDTNGYQQRSCSKCGFSTTKSTRVWDATKYGQCVIA